jgi:hypothetical protein
MGYNTDFTGQLKLSKRLAYDKFIEINEYMARDHMSEDLSQLGIGTRWCDWRLEEDALGQQYFCWNGSEKSYNMYEWMQFIYKRYLEPEGITLSGLVEAVGEEPYDTWAIVFDKENKEVKRLRGSITYDA